MEVFKILIAITQRLYEEDMSLIVVMAVMAWIFSHSSCWIFVCCVDPLDLFVVD